MAASFDLRKLASSPSTADNLRALTRIRDGPILYTLIAPHLNGLFTRYLQHADPFLRVMAGQAFLSLADYIGRIGDNYTIHSLYEPLTGYLISCEQDLPSKREDDNSILPILNSLASSIPPALAPHLAAIVTLCHNVMETVRCTENTPLSRQQAVDLLESISEHLADSIPVKSLTLIVDSCLLAMSKLDWGSTEWIKGTETKFMEEAAQGIDCLSRVVCNLRDMNIDSVVLDETRRFLLNCDWRRRLAGVMGLEFVGTMDRTVLMDRIVGSLAPVLRDPDAIVRGAACNAISTLVPNLGPNSVLIQDIVPVLVDSMADTSIPRVTSKAAAAASSSTVLSPSLVLVAPLLLPRSVLPSGARLHRPSLHRLIVLVLSRLPYPFVVVIVFARPSG